MNAAELQTIFGPETRPEYDLRRVLVRRLQLATRGSHPLVRVRAFRRFIAEWEVVRRGADRIGLLAALAMHRDPPSAESLRSAVGERASLDFDPTAADLLTNLLGGEETSNAGHRSDVSPVGTGGEECAGTRLSVLIP